jgi:hypothetical protein
VCPLSFPDNGAIDPAGKVETFGRQAEIFGISARTTASPKSPGQFFRFRMTAETITADVSAAACRCLKVWA